MRGPLCDRDLFMALLRVVLGNFRQSPPKSRPRGSERRLGLVRLGRREFAPMPTAPDSRIAQSKSATGQTRKMNLSPRARCRKLGECTSPRYQAT